MLLPQRFPQMNSCFPQINAKVTSISSQRGYKTNHANQIIQSV
jgi:hypothetical protein